ncbi:MAG TPA: efflux RND transporter periplasmic adaptor subunit [Phycisphaeraceae bacterium]
MTAAGPSLRIRRRRWLYAAIGGGVLAVGAAVGVASLGGLDKGQQELATFVVQRGPLVISVTEAGTIKAREQVVLKSEVEGRTTIIYLVPEGTRVKPGDLLVELDASALEDSRVNQEINVQNAQAAFIRARENLEVVKNQAESDIARAELDHQFAKEDLTKYIEGEYPNEVKSAESRITLAREELERAAEKLKWSERLFQEKYISQTELESDRLAQKRAELDYELALAERDLLEQYTYKRRLAELKSNVEQTAMALERVKRKASADIVQAEAELRAKKAELDRQSAKLAKIEDQIAKCKIYAPTAGMVVYATTGRGNWRGNEEPLDEGQEVRERQELIYLPAAGPMMAEVKVHESSLDKVQVGQPVRITVDALPGKVFSGRVTRISPLPDAQSVWLNPDLKVYSTDIVLDQDTPDIRTGMSCRAEIIVETYDEAVYVPVQSVLRVGRQPTVYVFNGQQVQPRPVELGLDNNRMVRVVRGVDPGELVLLSPPLAPAVVTADRLNFGHDSDKDESSPAAPAGQEVALNQSATQQQPSSAVAAAQGDATKAAEASSGQADQAQAKQSPASPSGRRRADGPRRLQNASPDAAAGAPRRPDAQRAELGSAQP